MKTEVKVTQSRNKTTVSTVEIEMKICGLAAMDEEALLSDIEMGMPGDLDQILKARGIEIVEIPYPTLDDDMLSVTIDFEPDQHRHDSEIEIIKEIPSLVKQYIERINKDREGDDRGKEIKWEMRNTSVPVCPGCYTTLEQLGHGIFECSECGFNNR